MGKDEMITTLLPFGYLSPQEKAENLYWRDKKSINYADFQQTLDNTPGQFRDRFEELVKSDDRCEIGNMIVEALLDDIWFHACEDARIEYVKEQRPDFDMTRAK